MRVITYNLLSSSLSTRASYPWNDLLYLDADNRFELILRAFEDWIKGSIFRDGRQWEAGAPRPVFCLQEVSLEWASRLQIFFEGYNYRFYVTNYGIHPNGYMGVAIAVPSSAKVLELVIDLPNSRLEWNGENKEAEKETSPALQSISRSSKALWNVIKSKYNRYIALHLRLTEEAEREVWVATYHMPCEFKRPSILTTMAILLFSELQSLAGGLPLVVAGDFNISPDGETFRLITEAVTPITTAIGFEGAPRDWDIYPLPDRMSVVPPLPFTSRVLSNVKVPTAFIGTLDYIFYKGEDLHFTDLEEVRLSEEIMPNATHPSDHLPVIANFTFQPPRQTFHGKRNSFGFSRCDVGNVVFKSSRNPR